MALLDEFQESLDRAIACTAGAEFNRLRQGLQAETVAVRIHRAMVELEKLRRLRMPDYQDAWVIPLYASWYQPRQVNLAYSLIRRIMSQQNGRLTRNAAGNLCVLDFGCGASATQFGLTLAVADAIQDRQTIGRVEVYGVDTSQPMIDMGERLWEAWGEEIASEGVLRDAYKTVESGNTSDVAYFTPLETLRADSDRWLVALHTAYKSNRSEVREHLRRIDDAFNPRVGFVTSHVSNRLNVRRISPFDDAKPIVRPAGKLYIDCDETTELRRGISYEFHGHLPEKDFNYLGNQVRYDIEPSYCLLHIM